MTEEAFEVSQYDLDANTVVTVLNIDKLSEPLRELIDSHLVEICEGTYSDSLLEDVKERVKELFGEKQSKNAEEEYSNWEMGAVAEFFIHLYLKQVGLKQECMFFNLEERSIKKGFDGYYSNDVDQWIMESKSGSIKSVDTNHKSKIQEAVNDLKKKFSGNGVKNNPWRNAYNHASHVDVGSADKIRQYLKKLSQDFTKDVPHNIQDFNIIPCATIYYEDDSFEEHENIYNAVTNGFKSLGKKTHIICVSHKSVGIFKEYIGI